MCLAQSTFTWTFFTFSLKLLFIFTLLGGIDIPCEVEAQINLDKPVRSITLQWKEPQKKLPSPSHYLYKVVIRPETGNRKELHVQNCQTTIFHLKSSTKYFFEVNSVYEEGKKKSLAAKSNYITTASSKKHTYICNKLLAYRQCVIKTIYIYIY